MEDVTETVMMRRKRMFVLEEVASEANKSDAVTEETG